MVDAPTTPRGAGRSFVRHLVIAVVVALAATGIALVMIPRPSSQAGATEPIEAPVGQLVDFTLAASSAAPFRLSSLRGRVVIVYFGYASCPDVCPTGLASFAAGIGRLDAAEREHVTVVFVSVDPERDSPRHVAEYAAWFDPRIRGVTGAPAEVAAAAATFGATYRKAWPKGASDYVIDHTALGYVIAPDGRLVAELPHAAPPDTIVAALRPWMPRP